MNEGPRECAGVGATLAVIAAECAENDGSGGGATAARPADTDPTGICSESITSERQMLLAGTSTVQRATADACLKRRPFPHCTTLSSRSDSRSKRVSIVVAALVIR